MTFKISTGQYHELMHKELNVTTRNQAVHVRLNNTHYTDKLTPKMARQAVAVAGFVDGTVYDWDNNIAYRVYRNSTRKLKIDGRLS